MRNSVKTKKKYCGNKSAPYYGPYDKPDVVKHRGNQAIVFHHYFKPLSKRSLMIGRSHALGKIIGKNSSGIHQRHTFRLSLLHHSYAPVEISRKAVAQIIRQTNILIDIKRLMANKHAVAERTARQLLRRSKPAGTKTHAVSIDDISISINNTCQAVFAVT